MLFFADGDVPNEFGSFAYLGRLDQNGNEVWRHPLPNSSEDYAVHSDGTIFLAEDNFDSSGHFFRQVVGVDGGTGQTKFTVPVPELSQGESRNFGSLPDPHNPNIIRGPLCRPGVSSVGAPQAMRRGMLSISADGTVYLPLSSSYTILDGMPCDPSDDPDHPGLPKPVDPVLATWSDTATLQLMKISSTGSFSIETLDTIANGGANWGLIPALFNNLGRAVPDGQAVLYPEAGKIYHSDGTASFYDSPLAVLPDGDPLLVGENGIAFVKGDNQVAAFDVTTGAVRCSYTSPIFNVTLNTVTAEDGIVIEEGANFSNNVLTKLDQNCQPTPLFPANPNLYSSNYWTLGTWNAALSDHSLAAIHGFGILPAAEYSQIGGNASHQGTPRIPEISHFEATDPDPIPPPGVEPTLARDLPRRVEIRVPQVGTTQDNKPKANHHYFVNQGASGVAYLHELHAKISAVGFIGHGVYAFPATVGSTGMCFFLPPADPNFPPDSQPADCLQKTPEYTDIPGNTDPNVTWVTLAPHQLTEGHSFPKLETDARVVFIGACQLGEAFKKWWNIDVATKGKALVVPINNNDTYLGVADLAWLEITKHLAAGKTIQFAVTEANREINSRNWRDSNGNQVNPSLISNWQVIGDGNVRVAGKRVTQ